MAEENLVSRLNAEIAKWHLLKHPFYQDWQAGKLSRERLRLYAEQYYLHVEAFPVHLETVAGRAKGGLRDIVVENLAEERNPSAPHPKLWRDFAAAIGVTEEQLWASAPLAGTKRLVETYAKVCREASLEEAVAALYAYEAQVPEIATSKMDGLRRHYGVHSPEALAYFAVHEEADRLHRVAWRGWLEENVEVARLAEKVAAATKAALQALWRALDDIQAAPC
jgi:pyrroloquinoline-quinone synthase